MLANIFVNIGVLLPEYNTSKVEEVAIELEEEVPHAIERVLNPEAKRGTVKTVKKGINGLVRKKALVHYENGIEKSRQVISEIVLREMKPEVLSIGVKDTIMLTSRNLEMHKEVLNLEATAYTHTGNTTYTGVYPQVGTIAVDPKIIPLGTRMWVENYGYGIAQDTGGLIKGHIIDLFMDTEQECWDWGRRNVKVFILE
jgi:3D (Asp-Asp-Asp) domain-containing protein